MTASGQQPCPPGAGSVLLREFWIQQMLPEKKKKNPKKKKKKGSELGWVPRIRSHLEVLEQGQLDPPTLG